MIVLRPVWAWVVVGFLGLVGTAALVRDEFLPPDAAARLRFLYWGPNWSWQTWAIIGLGALLCVAFEGSFRAAEKQAERFAKVERRLKALDTKQQPELAFDPTDWACMNQKQSRHPPYQTAVWYAVCLRNPSAAVTLDDVTVSLDPSPFAEQIHSVGDDLPPYPRLFGPAPLHPGGVVYLPFLGLGTDLSRYHFDDDAPDTQGIVFPQNVGLRVTARDVGEVYKVFVVDPRTMPQIKEAPRTFSVYTIPDHVELVRVHTPVRVRIDGTSEVLLVGVEPDQQDRQAPPETPDCDRTSHTLRTDSPSPVRRRA